MEDPDTPELEPLRARLEQEERAYAHALAELERRAALSLPHERRPEMAERLARLNQLWETPAPPAARGLRGHHARAVWGVVQPALARQQEFNSALVQLLNAHFEETAPLHEQLRELAAALLRFTQRLLPLVDARDRHAVALATTRAELILESFDRRLEALGRRLQGLLAIRDRVGAASEELRALRRTLESEGPPPPATAQAAVRAAEDSVYAAFENRYRGSAGEIRTRLAEYVALFRGQEPVADLGCGRGEFLDLLREAGIGARGVDGNAHVAAECRARGLDVAHGDLVAFLGGQPDATLGGVFAAQVAEHLLPRVLQAMLRESHRVLRPGGLLVLETVNPRSVVGLLEVYNRDLTHERPLHPDTLSFLAAAAGFTDVRVELRTPVEPAAQLQPVPGEGLPERFVQALNENVARLNGLLYGQQEYALIARR